MIFAVYNFRLFSIQVKTSEANGFATVLRRVLLYNLPNIFKDISDELRNLLLQQMFVLTCHFIESSIHEDTVLNYTSCVKGFQYKTLPIFQDCLSESVYSDALDIILEAWLLIIQGKEVCNMTITITVTINKINKLLLPAFPN